MNRLLGVKAKPGKAYIANAKVVIRLELCKFISLKKQPSVGKRLTAVFQYGFG